MAHKNLIQWVNTFNTTASSGEPTWYYWDTANVSEYNFFPKQIEKEFDETLNKLWANRECPIIKDKAALPKTNAFETNEGLFFESFIPFATKEEVKVTLDPLTNGIKIEVDSHQPEEDREYYLSEVSRTSFKRSFAIDKRFDVKKAKANFENGILEIKIPFAEDAEKIQLKL